MNSCRVILSVASHVEIAGDRLKRIQKTKPLKKIAETDAIFANIEERKEQARLFRP